MSHKSDKRIVLTLDAGGTNFVFSAIRGGQQVGESIILPAEGDDLDASLNNILSGFQQLRDNLPERPVAISFAFPGPADYPNGIIYNVGNLPAYRDGVALGPMLQDHFDVPVFINNDGDLFAYGEALAGFLPQVNTMLADAGSPKRFRNLLAVTLGTGFGGGIVSNGELFSGDNSAAGEIWLLRNKVRSEAFAEEGASIRAVSLTYAIAAGIDPAKSPTPEAIYNIGTGSLPGNQGAALKAFQQLGEVVGDALANALTLIDGVAVIGGGLSGAAPLFMPHLVAEMNGTICKYNGRRIPRLAQRVYDLTDDTQIEMFLQGQSKEIVAPRSNRTIRCDPEMRIGVGISKLGTNKATSLGAYLFALQKLEERGRSG